jgi:hypothetical protein
MNEPAVLDRVWSIIKARDPDNLGLRQLYMKQIEVQKSTGSYADLLDDAIILDYDLFIEQIADDGDDVLTGAFRIDIESETTLSDDDDYNPYQEEPQTYLESISGSFVCPWCRIRFQERKGQLAYEPPFGDPALCCAPCIQEHVLVIIPEVKDQRKGG